MAGDNQLRVEELDSIRSQITLDKQIAGEVLQKAGEKAIDPIVHLSEDITGAPKAAKSFNRYIHEQRQAIDSIRREMHFISRIETSVSHWGATPENRAFLIAKQRLVNTGLRCDRWTVISWTAPITEKLLNGAIGDSFEHQADRESPIVTFEIKSSAKYGVIFPEVKQTTYTLPSRKVYVEHERDFASESMEAIVRPILETRPESPYKAAEDFGLSEIIEVVDTTQRSVMHLPFEDTILVEGPPGSGKTSIGLMRIPCLIDRQWEELGLNQKDDLPFHDTTTMRVLVLNEEMVDYLAKLIRNVGVQGVKVQTFDNFCQQLCRNARTLSGIHIRESPQLARLKLHAKSPAAYWGGFRAAVRSFWERHRDRLLRALSRVDLLFGEALFDELERWVSVVDTAVAPESATGGSINFPNAIRNWRHRCQQSRTQLEGYREQEQATVRLERLQKFFLKLAKRLFDRHSIVRSLIQSDEFDRLSALALSPEQVSTARNEWLKQARERQIAESDSVLAAWLATFVSHVSEGDERVGLGMHSLRFTHFVIDEAQDISPCHIRLIRRLLAAKGTITLVGDLRQRITPYGFFDRWEDLGIEHVRKAVFAVNHRQSKPLGEFIRSLHECIYQVRARWKSSARSGPLPRLRRQRGNAGLAEAAAAEVRHWRQIIPNASVGVLYFGKRWGGLRVFADRIESDLQDTLTSVHIAVGGNQAHYLARSDCAIIATVKGTKGLEFDAVVVIDPHRYWRQPLENISVVTRNAMYVGASRARQGLSLIVDDRSILMDKGIDASFFERIDA